MLSPLVKTVPLNAPTGLSGTLATIKPQSPTTGFSDQIISPSNKPTFSYAKSDGFSGFENAFAAGIEIVQAPLIDFNSPFKPKDPQPKKPNGPVLVL